MTVVGARPQFVKAAAVSRAIDAVRAQGRGIEEILVHTGQHYDAGMSDVFFRELRLRPPAVELRVGSADHGAQTGAMMSALEDALREVRPSCVLVYGDTNSTLAGALVGVKQHVPVVHVEAGLRSYDRAMPEEINRVVTDHVAALLLCPSDLARRNLANEGISAGVHVVGDVMYDVFRIVGEEAGEVEIPDLDHRALGSRVALVTVHRASNTDDPEKLGSITNALDALARTGVTVVWPVHPRTRKVLGERKLAAGVHMIPPVGYVEMLALLRRAEVVLTDSGGLQKEALWSATPCVTLRDTTEWQETIDSGWNVLVGADTAAILAAATRRAPGGAPPPLYGDGHAADRIVELLWQFGADR